MSPPGVDRRPHVVAWMLAHLPIAVLIDKGPDGAHLSYDRMASFLATYGNRDARRVAEDLDNKVATLLREAAA